MKPRLSSLKIENFRMLENLEIKKLGNVNLIVGKNNSGKSTVLEALRVYAGCANPNLLNDISKSRDEIQFEKIMAQDDDFLNDFPIHYQHFFSGRKFPENDDCPIVIGEINNNALHISHVLVAQYQEEKTTADGSIERLKKTKNLSKLTHTLVDGSPIDGENVDILQAIFCKKDESTLYKIVQGDYRPRGNNSRSSLAKLGNINNIDEINCAYIPTTIFSGTDLGTIWDSIVLTDQRELVYQALQIISEDFKELAFIANPNSLNPIYRSRERLIIVKLNGQKPPIPLSSMGDGMLRILSLILNLISAKDGFLLIDEFENGLHYSIQPKVWTLIFKLAKDFNIQVFATTHSKDCVESFSEEVLKNDEVEGVVIRMSRSVAKNNLNAVIAIEYSEESMTTASYQNMEVR